MEGNLVIVESPAKARTIQKFLGDDFVVKSSRGHIRDLKDKSLSVDLEHGFAPEYIVPADKKQIVADLKKAAKGATVWLASDEDREGEAISWHLAETLGLDPSNTRRIVFHEITRDAILNAIRNPRTIDMGLVYAQQARRVLDRLVGFELSPVLWRRIQRGLSAGRVQSVALRLIVDKEKEIMAFNSESSYKVEGLFLLGGTEAKGQYDSRFNNIDDARAFLDSLKGALFKVCNVEKKDGSRNPSAPFTTSTLQQEAAKKLHFPVGTTMKIAQSLYERGIITYMRTDSTNLSSLALGTARKYIIETYGEQYSHSRQYRTNSKGAQEAHEAIRPTYIDKTEIEGTEQEKKLYSLIWKRTVASQMESAKLRNTTVSIAAEDGAETDASGKKGNGRFVVQGSEIVFDGFLRLYNYSDDDDQEGLILPGVKTGDEAVATRIEAQCKYSQPPYRYSEGTLVKKLEELGIGRPSTYAPTITTLTTGRGYVVKGDKEGRKVEVTNLVLKGNRISESRKNETIGAEKGKLLPQEIGMIVTDFLTSSFSDILDYDFTARVEKDFDTIAEGGMQWNDVIGSFYGPFHKKVEDTLGNREYSRVERELGIDPSDGKKVVAKFGQYGPYVQKGEGENRQFASLSKEQLIENITLEEALNLFRLPRTVGSLDGIDVTVLKGRYGAYMKYGDKNISLPKGADPLTIDLETCIGLIREDNSRKTGPLLEFSDADISVLAGKYGPYIKHAGSNYKIPRGTDASTLTLDDCRRIISESSPTQGRKYRKYGGKS